MHELTWILEAKNCTGVFTPIAAFRQPIDACAFTRYEARQLRKAGISFSFRITEAGTTYSTIDYTPN